MKVQRFQAILYFCCSSRYLIAAAYLLCMLQLLPLLASAQYEEEPSEIAVQSAFDSGYISEFEAAQAQAEVTDAYIPVLPDGQSEEQPTSEFESGETLAVPSKAEQCEELQELVRDVKNILFWRYNAAYLLWDIRTELLRIEIMQGKLFNPGDWTSAVWQKTLQYQLVSERYPNLEAQIRALETTMEEYQARMKALGCDKLAIKGKSK